MKKFFEIAADVLAWVVLLLAFLVTLIVFSSERNNGVPTFLGFMPMSVETDSMAPTFNSGDLIIVKQIDDLYTLKEDDVITFYTMIEGKRVKNTHRITQINENGSSRNYNTKGDANPIGDESPVYASDIIGRWTGIHIPKLGLALNFLRTKTGFFVCILIPLAIFFLFELYKFIVALVESKKPALSAEDEEEIRRKAVEEYLAEQAKKAEAEKTETAAVAEEATKAVEETAKAVEETVTEAATDAASAVSETAEAAKDTVEKAAESVAEETK